MRCPRQSPSKCSFFICKKLNPFIGKYFSSSVHLTVALGQHTQLLLSGDASSNTVRSHLNLRWETMRFLRFFPRFFCLSFHYNNNFNYKSQCFRKRIRHPLHFPSPKKGDSPAHFFHFHCYTREKKIRNKVKLLLIHPVSQDLAYTGRYHFLILRLSAVIPMNLRRYSVLPVYIFLLRQNSASGH